MQVFYLPDAQIGLMNLPEEESKHCVRVLRMQCGDKFCVSDGAGYLYCAEMMDANPKRVSVMLTDKRPGYDHWNFSLRVSVAPTKMNERTEWFLEKATEIGIDQIDLFASCHSERKVANVERFQKILVSAMKQSIKSRLPLLSEMVNFEKLISQPFEGQKFIAWIDDSIHNTLCDSYHKGENVWILIGPEGDFSTEEVLLAKQQGFVPVSLGEARLRTETAALVVCHTIQLINQMK